MATPEFVAFANAGSEGTRMPRAKWEHVAKVQKTVPPISIQRRIAHILRTLDGKIELNRRMNRTLKKIAGGAWHHVAVILHPQNKAFQPILLSSSDEREVQVVAELVEVLHTSTYLQN